ncbi:hypothetical protein HDU96_007988 [Phlyctochytrium bullatum]|nr:hypothetical protein HDU96_007988 [Phlyctochytrium bullatum]
MHLQHFIQQEMETEARDYFERKHIHQIMESIITGLSFSQPDDPLAFIEDCVQRLKKSEVLAGKSRIKWDQFIPTPAKDATAKRKEGHRKLTERGKKAHNTPVVPLLPPVKGAFIMPEAKPLLKGQSGSSFAQNVKHRDPLPALPRAVPAAADSAGWAVASTAAPAPEVNHPNIVFVLGGPGSGKGTQCARLAKEFGLCHISTGDLLRLELERGTEIGKQCGDLMKEGKIVPMSIIIGLLKKTMLENIDTPGFLIDGFPRALDQAMEFERTIGRCKTVLYFSCPLQVLEARLLERGKTSGRADDNIATIKKRFKTFEEQSLPVVDYYKLDGRVVEISSTTTIDEVYEQTRSHFASKDEPTKLPARTPLPKIPSTAGRLTAVEKDAFPKTPEGRPLTKSGSALDSEMSKDRQSAWKNIIFVLGGPGCGKGTQCVRLAKEFNLCHLSAGDLLREEVASGSARAKELDALMKEGKIVPMEITIKLLREAMERDTASAGFLIDGFPRQLDQAKAFEASVAPCRFVLFFDCPEDILEKRLLKRGETSGRADDNIETIKKRFKTFVNTSMPVVEYFRRMGKCVTVSSVPPPDEVYENAQSYFSNPEKALSLPIVHNNLIFVLGGPGSGKGTQCARLAKEFNYAHLSTGDLLRDELAKGSEIGQLCGNLMKEGQIVPMNIVIGLLRAAIIENIDSPGILIDGFPRAVDQAQLFENTIAKPSKVIFFHCPLETLEARLLERGKTSGRGDDNLETIKKRFKTFEEQSLPVVDYYKDCVLRISSTGPIDEVYSDLKRSLNPPIVHDNLIFVLGGPGSGKGTQCARLAKDFNYAHLSTGDLLRAELTKGSEIGQLCGNLMKEGQIVPMNIVIDLLRSAIIENIDAPGILIDGFPRAVDQAQLFENTIAKPSKVIFFHCPLETLEARLLERGKTSGRGDDNLETIKKRFKTFEEQSLPVVDYYKDCVLRISSTGTIDEVYSDLTRSLNSLPFDGDNIVFVLGGPGSGKGTQCDRLVESLNYAHLSTGDLLRDEVKKGSELGQQLEAIMKEGKLIPLETTLKLLVVAMKERRGKHPGFLIDGFPRNMEQAIEFEKTVGRCKFVLFFDAPNDVLTARLLKRGETSGRADDNLESIKKRLDTFQEASLPVISHFEKDGRVRRILATGEVDGITAATLECFKELQ